MNDSSFKNKKPPITPKYTRESINRYQKNTVKRIGIDFYRDTDSEIIAHMEQLDNMSDFIRMLVFLDLKQNPDPNIPHEKQARRYQKSDCRRISILLNKVHDSEIIQRLGVYPNRSLYIRGLAANWLSQNEPIEPKTSA